ncbi:uncharacterized protein EV422DRAFT_503797 [Fimicolochytrium jonesii]|uniref:uncharacterized protein n=1 Tax=Fimicolochytrium jonesii TaxID=1396493 RepID=UPI0022FDCE25|nr:uncharacterized protein EV422DRAFT_503797 [Fimicolochytrium jonesii]KAI8825029.1 hypothetical protein EV422DRAFT_503797 [Fimicolochytrium jonesii]
MSQRRRRNEEDGPAAWRDPKDSVYVPKPQPPVLRIEVTCCMWWYTRQAFDTYVRGVKEVPQRSTSPQPSLGDFFDETPAYAICVRLLKNLFVPFGHVAPAADRRFSLGGDQPLTPSPTMTTVPTIINGCTFYTPVPLVRPFWHPGPGIPFYQGNIHPPATWGPVPYPMQVAPFSYPMRKPAPAIPTREEPPQVANERAKLIQYTREIKGMLNIGDEEPNQQSPRRQSTKLNAPAPAAEYRGANVYVGNLPPTMTDERLKKMGSSFGAIVSSKAIVVPNTKICKGYGFILFKSNISSAAAIHGLNRMGYRAKIARAAPNHAAH